MNALLRHFHNFFLPLVRGHERVCQCVCGSEEAYRVVPYHGATPTVDINDCCYRSYIMTQQEMYLIVGILLGLCICWMLMLLGCVLHRTLPSWRTIQQSSGHFWSLMPKFKKIKNLFGQPHAEHSEESSGNIVHVGMQVNGKN